MKHTLIEYEDFKVFKEDGKTWYEDDDERYEVKEVGIIRQRDYAGYDMADEFELSQLANVSDYDAAGEIVDDNDISFVFYKRA